MDIWKESIMEYKSTPPIVSGIMFKTDGSRNHLHYINLIYTGFAENLGTPYWGKAKIIGGVLPLQ